MVIFSWRLRLRLGNVNVSIHYLALLVLEFGTVLYLMSTSRNDVFKESAFETAADWYVSHERRFRANMIIWGMRKHYSLLRYARF